MTFHRVLIRRKYQRLFASKRGGKPGPKGPSPELVAAIVALKTRNPRFGSQRIAEQIAFTFGVDIDKDVVRRVLAKHWRPQGGGGPSWLSFLGHSKDSLWSLDLFRCESLFLRSHWVMAVIDQYSRRIVGFAVHAGVLDHVPFWHAADLERKLRQFRDYYNEARVHHSLGGVTPSMHVRAESRRPASLAAYHWRPYCRGLYELPVAAQRQFATHSVRKFRKPL